MQRSEQRLFNPPFTHIYIERQAMEHQNTKQIIEKFPNARIVEITHYKDVFSRGHQNLQLQKKSPSLILGIKKENIVYKGAPVCENFGNEHFYYTSLMMNCIYDCHYCYLQGMYTSGHIVIFVNMEDYFKEVDRLLYHQPVYLCISYDTDILALESILGYGGQWIEFARKRPHLKVELRTKSANFDAIQTVEPSDNVILAWTLSPEDVIRKYESKTPSYRQRLNSIQQGMEKGWKVRLCFDPILRVDQWRESYRECVDTTFQRLPVENIEDVSIGAFRVSKDYLKRMRKNRKDSALLNYPYDTINGVCSYDKELEDTMISYVYQHVRTYIPRDKIYI